MTTPEIPPIGSNSPAVSVDDASSFNGVSSFDGASSVGGAPRVSEACLSDLGLDQLADDARGPHLDGCDRCRARAALFLEHRHANEMRAVAILRRAQAETSTTRWYRRPVFGLVGAGAVAAVMVLIPVVTALDDAVSNIVPGHVDDDRVAAVTGVRAKGLAVKVWVKRGDLVVETRSGDAFRNGDALRVELPHARGKHVMLLGVEDSGKTSVYFPFGESASRRLDDAQGIIPGSLVLDDSDAREVLIAAVADGPMTRAEIDSALEAKRVSSSVAGDSDSLNRVHGITFVEFVLERGAPSDESNDRFRPTNERDRRR